MFGFKHDFYFYIYIFKCLVHERFNTIYKRIIGFRAKGI